MKRINNYKEQLASKWGDERVVPGLKKYQESYYRQLVAYNFSKSFVLNKVVLDIGCGEGYGSNYLSKYAKKIIGIDFSGETIEHAKSNYKKNNIEFMKMDAINLSFPNNFFDVVCFFQAIEHIRDYNKCLAEIQRVLKPGGFCIISTPNKETRLVLGDVPFNPFHIQEFSVKELHKLLQIYFNTVELYGIQGNARIKKKELSRFKYRSFIRRLRKLTIYQVKNLIPKEIRMLITRGISKIIGISTPLSNVDLEDFTVSKINIRNSLDLLAVCEK